MEFKLNPMVQWNPRHGYRFVQSCKPKLGIRPTWIFIMVLANHQPSILHIPTFMNFLVHISKQSSIKFGNKDHSISTNVYEVLQFIKGIFLHIKQTTIKGSSIVARYCPSPHQWSSHNQTSMWGSGRPQNSQFGFAMGCLSPWYNLAMV